MKEYTIPSGHELLYKAFEESAGKTVDVVIDQEVPGVTPEMFGWWMGKKILTDYTLWYPEMHLSNTYEHPPGGPPIVSIEEYVGAYYTIFRCQLSDGKLIFINPDGKPIGGLVHIPQPAPNGMKLRSTFTYPAKTPAAFRESTYGHCIMEMQDLPRFLPELFKKEAK